MILVVPVKDENGADVLISVSEQLTGVLGPRKGVYVDESKGEMSNETLKRLYKKNHSKIEKLWTERLKEVKSIETVQKCNNKNHKTTCKRK